MWAGGPALLRNGVRDLFSLQSYFCVLHSCIIFSGVRSLRFVRSTCVSLIRYIRVGCLQMQKCMTSNTMDAET